ncbi:N-acetylneuraminate synthase family protein [Candidatus Pelagibacter sp.]|nr:N-acetylneuraminate synthase family protein [Candidatus Pelagibacter sp.]
MTKIIAELCQNHNGDLKILEEMVHSAYESGADIIKVQSMHSDELSHRERFDTGLIEGGKTKTIKRPYQSEYDRLKKLDLNLECHQRFLEICRKYKVTPCTTIFSLSKIDMIEKLGFELVKIASFDCASTRLLKEVSSRSFKEIIISTGATFNREISRAVEILSNSNKKFSLLHCVSIYPTSPQDAHLSRIEYLRTLTKNVGLSDHSNPELHGNLIPAVALYLGVNFIEKHFTVLPKDQTKDGPVSANPVQLKELTTLAKKSKEDIKDYINSKIDDYQILLGDKYRDMSNVELLNRDYYQGRFASKNKSGKIVFNWDEESEFRNN